MKSRHDATGHGPLWLPGCPEMCTRKETVSRVSGRGWRGSPPAGGSGEPASVQHQLRGHLLFDVTPPAITNDARDLNNP